MSNKYPILTTAPLFQDPFGLFSFPAKITESALSQLPRLQILQPKNSNSALIRPIPTPFFRHTNILRYPKSVEASSTESPKRNGLRIRIVSSPNIHNAREQYATQERKRYRRHSSGEGTTVTLIPCSSMIFSIL